MPPLDKVYDYSQYGGLLVEKQDRVMTITLNAPESMNAFSAEMHHSMSRIWEDVHDDPEVNVVVSVSIQPSSRGVENVLIGAVIAPIFAAPNAATSHSVRLVTSSATRSPRRTPATSSARAKPSARALRAA